MEAHREARNSSKSQHLGRGSEFFQSPPDIFSKGHFPNVTSSRRGGVSKYEFGGIGENKDMKHVNFELSPFKETLGLGKIPSFPSPKRLSDPLIYKLWT